MTIGFHSLPIVTSSHNLLDVFIGDFYCAIHLRDVWRRIVMIDLELRTEFHNHSIVEISSVVGDDPFGDTVTIDEVMLDKSGYNVLCD